MVVERPEEGHVLPVQRPVYFMSVEPLLLYVAAMTQVVSVVVVVERLEEGHALPVQRPVYFISEVLSETKV